jgi:hypothetical protein
MREADDGLFIGFVDLPSGPHSLVLVQDDRGAYYERRHGAPLERPAWRDFYFAAGHAAIDWSDWLWRPATVAVKNLSGGPALIPDALVAFLEGIGYLLDRRSLALRTLIISGHEGLHDELARAETTLDREQRSSPPPNYRPLLVQTWDPVAIGYRGRTAGLKLLRVDLGPFD